jgi:plasmid stabilization system protein ParE
VTRKVAFSDAALRDLDDIFEYLAERLQDLAIARRFVDSLLDNVEKIASLSTMMGRPREELASGLRSTRYEERSLLVVDILHARRDARALIGPKDDSLR